MTSDKTGRAGLSDPWALLLGVLTIAVVAYGTIYVPNFASPFNLSQLAAGMAEKALLVLPMVLLIIGREIDLSVASILALSSVVFGLLLQAAVPMGLTVPLVILFGAALGAVNGILVAAVGLPSLVVTLGTMALYRGIGFIILGSGSINTFPDAVTTFGISYVPGTRIPLLILPFLFLAPVFAIWLQLRPFGRRVYAVGGNPAAALYSGIMVNRLKFWLFVVSGAVCAIAGMVYTARLANARANNATGMELDVITMVLLGGISVWGGKGRLTGVFLAMILVAVIRNILGISQIGGDVQGLVIGSLLIGSLLISNSTGFLVAWVRQIGAQSKLNG
jgi:rhamnose transport system permease protein